MIGNKRGQIGQIVATVPVIIIVFLIMIGFVVASYYIGLGRGTAKTIEAVGDGEDLLLKEMTFKGERERVLDVVIFYWRAQISSLELGEIMENLVSEDACLAFAQGEDPEPAGQTGGAADDDYYVRLKGGEKLVGHRGSKPALLAAYEKAGVFRELHLLDEKYQGERNVEGNELYIQYYFGRCTDE
jgi:hypothetical protein